MAARRVKFGVLSTATISDILVPSIKAIPEAECTAIASRDINKAKAFAEKHDIPHACSYSELLTLPIDAVYIPLPSAMIAEWAVLCAKAGKHVLVDKPLHSKKTVQDMIDACEQNGVVFLDGTHFVHSARTKEVQRRISCGDIGKIRRIDAAYSFPTPAFSGNIRSNPDLEPQGYLGDLGWYCIRAGVTYLGAEVASKIISVTCSGKFHPQFPGCTQYGYGIVEFGTADDKVALCFSFDARGPLHQRVAILGELGLLETLSFVVPVNQSAVFESIRPSEKFDTDTEYTYERSVAEFDGDSNTMVFPSKERVTVVDPENRTQPENMFQEFCRLILDDDKEAAKKWARESLVTQAILDVIMAKMEKQEASERYEILKFV